MGGRDQERERPDREAWVSEVSTDRLKSYARMMDSSGSVQRADGSARPSGTQTYFRDLVNSELQKRQR